MGYTHYWDRPDEISVEHFDQIRDDLAVALPALTELTGTLEILISDETITINGVGDAGHETFVLERIESEDWRFCKTARKPYDTAVCFALIIAQYYCPEFRVSTDGDNDDEGWVQAREILADMGSADAIWSRITREGKLVFDKIECVEENGNITFKRI